jgi:hypothetical protein
MNPENIATFKPIAVASINVLLGAKEGMVLSEQ